jgi:HEPN domain-containing protein
MSGPEGRWLYFAAQDLQTAEVVLRAGIHAQACFHAQQCAEKALKGLLLASTGRAPRRTHSIAELLRLLPEKTRHGAPDELALVLDAYYILTRYPDAIAGPLPDALPGQEEAQQAVELARQALRWVEAETESRR